MGPSAGEPFDSAAAPTFYQQKGGHSFLKAGHRRFRVGDSEQRCHFPENGNHDSEAVSAFQSPFKVSDEGAVVSYGQTHIRSQA